MTNVLNFPAQQGYRLMTGDDLNKMIEAINAAFASSSGQIGQPGGTATLDSNGKVTASQLPLANPTALIGMTAVNGSASTLMRSDGAPAISPSIAPTWTGIHTFTLGTKLDGGVSSYLGLATVGAGVPAEIAQINSATGLNSNQSSATLFAVPAGNGGIYRISAYAVLVTADGASSTLPNIGIGWTDKDTSVPLVAGTVTPTNTANAAGAFGTGVQILNAKGGTNITWQTANYASGTAGAMTYAVRIRLEYLG